MSELCDTLFLPLRQGIISGDVTKQKTLFLNAALCAEISELPKEALSTHQDMKASADRLSAAGYHVRDLEDLTDASYDTALVLIPKNTLEAKDLIARALTALAPKGTLIAAAANKSGGARLKKMLESFGLVAVQTLSKNKARVAWAMSDTLDQNAVNDALKQGALQLCTKTGYTSRPGIFGWDKIDHGSQILTQVLPQTLKGTIADFGCGYGYLASHVLKTCPKITSLTCIDIDRKAIESCSANIERIEHAADRHMLWHDLTEPPPKAAYHSIIMNPPFHEGKDTKASLGAAMIKTAYQSLKPRGTLWMVANAHLPYEQTLETLFHSTQKVSEDKGFKVFEARK